MLRRNSSRATRSLQPYLSAATGVSAFGREPTGRFTAARANGGEVWHLIANNEGHGFQKENEDYRFWSTVLFWEKHLLEGAQN